MENDLEPLRPFVVAFVSDPSKANLTALIAEAFHLGADTERAACALIADSDTEEDPCNVGWAIRKRTTRGQ